jgi:hypothetical protein
MVSLFQGAIAFDLHSRNPPSISLFLEPLGTRWFSVRSFAVRVEETVVNIQADAEIFN